jgi:NAD(P)-dependent dehydrogenase (short-subunit alcohol dehydrogenase family)
MMSFANTLFDLAGTVGIVTGSSRGIGRAIAERYAQHGGRVVVSSRKRPACDEVANAIAANGGEAMVMPCNIGHKQELQALVDATLARWGRIDTLICNAAINPHFGPSIDVPDETYNRILDYNLRSTFWLCNMVIPTMVKQGGGSIILISSISGFQGNNKLGIYAITKAAEMQLARNLAVEWGPHQIRANCIAPGLIKTDFTQVLWSDPATLHRSEQLVPLMRVGQPDDVAGAAVFLASAAGRYMSGQTMLIDGGRFVANQAAT